VGDIFREIDEELRQERYEKLWQKYGRFFVGAAVAVIVGFAGWQGWTHYDKSQREAASAQYASALRLAAEGKNSEAASLFASLAEKGGNSYGVLSRFHQAALKAKAGDLAGAAADYQAIAAETGVESTLRDAALLFSVSHAMDQANADPQALLGRLEPLVAGTGPWRHSAQELSGLLKLRTGDEAGAKAQFQKIADDLAAPPNMRSRAAQVLSVIGG
tara:strand:- start:560 stop:1210 length:651 start_codon:yes stop_codon:yes gene_type:complete